MGSISPELGNLESESLQVWGHSLTPTSQDIGIGKGKYYSLNFPLRDGINDENYKSVFEPVSFSHLFDAKGSTLLWQVIQQVMESYDPAAVVLQCGTDSLAGDKLGCLNLSMRGLRL